MIIPEIGKPHKNIQNFSKTYSGFPGWIELPVRPGNQPTPKNPTGKGGKLPNTLFDLNSNIPSKHTFKEKRTAKSDYLMEDDKEKITYLIRAAELARQEGNMRPFGPDPTPAEQLGLRINILRRQKRKSLKWVSAETGYGIAELIAFECGLLPNGQILDMFTRIAQAFELTIPNNLAQSLQLPCTS